MWTAENRVRYERKGLRYESDPTDGEYALIEPFPPLERSVCRRSLVKPNVMIFADASHDRKARVAELSRMLGGQSEAARKHAESLLRAK